MKKWLIGFTCVFLANTAWGQNPAAPAPAQQPNPAVQACPPGGCPQQLKTVCVPEPSTKVKVSINYSSVTDKVCLKGCLFPFIGKCQSCETNCGNPYNKKYLVKKIVTQEEPTIKCVPVLVPAGDGRGLLHHGQPGVSAPQPGSVAPPVETIPVPPVPSKK